MTTMTDPLLSAGMVAFVGTPWRSDTTTPDDRVAAAVGPAALEVLPRIRLIVDNLYATDIWNTPSLAEVGQRAETWLRDRYPELSDAAVDALAKAFTYNWK
jgi:hypothetical protein